MPIKTRLPLVLAAMALPFMAGAAPAVVTAQTSVIIPGPSGRALTRFEIRVPTSVRSEPLTGRVYVIITADSTRDPRLQVARVGTPLFGHDVVGLAPGATAVVTGMDLGTPVFDMADIPAGDYWVQPFVNVYSEFKRADGHTLWMHDDQWEGQNWARSPGNIYGTPQKVHFDPKSKAVVKLVADHVIPPIVVPADNEYVQRFKFQSPSLTKFWGRPIYLGATVLLPRDYKTSTISYPVNYQQGHFGLSAPYGFESAPRAGAAASPSFRDEWLSDKFPRMLVVTFQHPTPYFDDSYAVNSVNSGPYGDAVMNELIPEIEKRYRVIKQPWARWLSGGSTGGWESLALQIYHPDFFGGTWSSCPDPVTFSDVEGVNMYKDANAFYKQYSEWQLNPTVNSREVNGAIRQTAQQRYWMEFVNGTHGRSGTGQQDVWQSTFGPIGADGYFKPAVDSRTGLIDHSVTDYWRENYDLMYYLQRNWTTVGPKLEGKIHVYVGNMDSFFLDRATRELQAWMKTTENPHYEGEFVYGDQKPHCWSGPGTSADRLKEMAEYGLRNMPQGTTTQWWNY
ncbi:MAG: alpha/beta hydrolase-fold protein [Gemmatimonadaceae bacterium]